MKKADVCLILSLMVSAFLAFTLGTQNVHAQCQDVLPEAGHSGVLVLSMATMNRLGVASYATQDLQFVPGPTRRWEPPQPARYVTVAPAAQVFSDRRSESQNFDQNQSDLVSLSFTTGNAPTATITLVSHHNVSSSFPITCSNTGIIHGSTPDVDYLFYLAIGPTPPPQQTLCQLAEEGVIAAQNALARAQARLGTPPCEGPASINCELAVREAQSALNAAIIEKNKACR